MDEFLSAIGAHDDPMAAWHVVRILLWAGRARPDGRIGHISPTRLAQIAAWPGDPEHFMTAIVCSKWLVESGDGFEIGGWGRHGGRVLAQREKFREQARDRQRRARARKNNGHGDVTRDTSVSHAPVTPRHGIEPEGEPEGEIEREKGENSPSDLLRGWEVEQIGSRKFGAIGGADMATITNLSPIYRHELDAALATRGRSWDYAAKVIVSYREEAAKGPAIPGNPNPPRKEGAFERSTREALEDYENGTSVLPGIPSFDGSPTRLLPSKGGG